MAARDKFVVRLGGVNRLDEVADDLRNIVASLNSELVCMLWDPQLSIQICYRPLMMPHISILFWPINYYFNIIWLIHAAGRAPQFPINGACPCGLG